MPDLVTRLKLDNSQYNTGVDSAKKKTQEFQQTADKANDSIKDLGTNGSKSAKDLIKEMSKMEEAGRSASNYRRQLAQIQKSIVDLTVGYRNMSKEMQQSDLGREVASKISELTEKAAQYKDAISDVQQEITKMASDTAAWDGMKMGIDTVSSSLQAFVSTGVLGERTTEQLVSVLAKLKAIEAGTNAVIKIGNALQRQSALMTSVAAVQSRALSRAKQLETVATGKATVAQRLFNTVAKANPYVLLAAAVIGVVTALAAFTKAADKAKQKQEDLNKALEDANDKMRPLATATGNAAYEFDSLRDKYVQCRTEGEKQQFLTEYKSKLEGMGISVNNLNDLERIFIGQTEAFRQACLLRAQYLAIENKIADEYVKAEEKAMEAQNALASVKPGDRINEGTAAFDILKEYGGYTTYVDRWGKDYVIAAENATEIVQSAIHDGFSKVKGQWIKSQDDLKQQVEDLGVTDLFNMSGNGTVNADTTKATDAVKKIEKEVINEIDLLKDEKKKLEDEKKYIEYGTDEWYKQLEAINEIDNKIKELEDAAAAYVNRLNSAPIEKLEPISPIKTPQLVTTKPQTIKVTPVLDNDAKVQLFQDAQNLASKIQDYVDLGLMDRDTAKKFIDNINASLAEEGIKAKVGIEFDMTGLSKSLSSFSSELSSVASAANGIVSPMNTIYESISGLSDRLDDAENGWESFFAVFQTGITIMESLAGIMQAVSTVTSALTVVKEAASAATATDTALTLANAAASVEATSAKLGEAAATGAVAAAEGGASVAKIPYVGGFIAAGIIGIIMGAIMASLSKAQSFATGGIVGGSSFNGDKVLARVNSGEMILNQQQQSNLFKMLNNRETNTSTAGQVEFKINGTELVGVLNNYNKKRTKI